MQIYFHSRLCSYLSRVPILVEGTVYDNQGLCSFQTLRTKFCLPAFAYFVFLQLRSALKAYGVPISSISSHPMRDWIAPSAGRLSVSLIYNKIIDCITKPLSIKTIWNRELSDLNLSVDWERVWSNLSLTSKNLAHRLIHFKVIHRAYIMSRCTHEGETGTRRRGRKLKL